MTKSNKRISLVLFFLVGCIAVVTIRCETFGGIAKAAGYSQLGDALITGGQAYGQLEKVYEAYNKEFTPKEEYYIGRSLAANLFFKYKPYKNGYSQTQEYISKIGQTLAMASDRPETFQGYRFILIDTPVINHFACPSGYIFITTGILQKCENEDEIAGILAHDIIHVVEKHPLQSISEAQKSEAVQELLSFSVSKAAGSQDLGKLTGIFDGVVDEIAQSMQEGYDFEQEVEADLLAVDLLVKTGYSPYGFVSILKKLDSYKRELFHGDPNQRVQKVQAKIEKYSGKVPQIQEVRSNRFKSILRTDGLVFIEK